MPRHHQPLCSHPIESKSIGVFPDSNRYSTTFPSGVLLCARFHAINQRFSFPLTPAKNPASSQQTLISLIWSSSSYSPSYHCGNSKLYFITQSKSSAAVIQPNSKPDEQLSCHSHSASMQFVFHHSFQTPHSHINTPAHYHCVFRPAPVAPFQPIRFPSSNPISQLVPTCWLLCASRGRHRTMSIETYHTFIAVYGSEKD